jgi:hypothetical protein
MATRVAKEFGVPSARFECATFDAVEVKDFDALYFFNPFEENLWGPVDGLDETVHLSRERFARDTVRAERMLAGVRVGTRVVTYYGFGSDMPPGFRLVLRERQRSGHLELWTKTEHVPWSPPPQTPHLLSFVPGGRVRSLQAAYRNEILRREEPIEPCPIGPSVPRINPEFPPRGG